jgi:type VI secretion system protein ImpK
MGASKVVAPQAAALSPAAERTNIALIYQEILTAITRLRSNRQAVSDAGSFRNQIKAAVASAEASATHKGYTTEDTRLATFAVVAFLDESILTANNPIFKEWPRMPLQEELFGVHTAGEMYFQCLDRLLARPDSPQTADVLEVYALCLALGYRGRYGVGGQEGIRTVVATVTEKLQRIRGGPRPLSLYWAPPRDAAPQQAYDPWVRRLGFGALGLFSVAVLLFIWFTIALVLGASGLASLAPLTTH